MPADILIFTLHSITMTELGIIMSSSISAGIGNLPCLIKTRGSESQCQKN